MCHVYGRHIFTKETKETDLRASKHAALSILVLLFYFIFSFLRFFRDLLLKVVIRAIPMYAHGLSFRYL